MARLLEGETMNETDTERRQRIERSHDHEMPWTGDEARHWPTGEYGEPRPCKPYRFVMVVTALADSPEDAREVADSAVVAVAQEAWRSPQVQAVHAHPPVEVVGGRPS
jgi:hypothetical protein